MAEIPAWIRQARDKWEYRGQQRPEFADPAAEGQESVWDYPRPPRVEEDAREVVVQLDETVVARTVRAVRVLETASPPTFYLPPADVRTEFLAPSPGGSVCEWKGAARYWSLLLPLAEPLVNAAWSYEEPFAGFEMIAGYLSFYPARLACFIDGVRADPQPGGLYGGWITPELAGPFKGQPGTEAW